MLHTLSCLLSFSLARLNPNSLRTQELTLPAGKSWPTKRNRVRARNPGGALSTNNVPGRQVMQLDDFAPTAIAVSHFSFRHSQLPALKVRRPDILDPPHSYTRHGFFLRGRACLAVSLTFHAHSIAHLV